MMARKPASSVMLNDRFVLIGVASQLSRPTERRRKCLGPSHAAPAAHGFAIRWLSFRLTSRVRLVWCRFLRCRLPRDRGLLPQAVFWTENLSVRRARRPGILASARQGQRRRSKEYDKNKTRCELHRGEGVR